MSRLFILGAGGHGAVVADAAAASGAWGSLIFLDDRMERGDRVLGWPVVGQFSGLAGLIGSEDECMVAIGNNERREFVMRETASTGRFATVIHPAAVISSSATLGVGTLVCAGVVVSARALIGEGCILNTGATVDHDCKLEKSVHVSPGAHLAGGVTVGRRSWIGIGAVVADGIEIGSDCIVGAGAAVISDIEDGTTVVGVPAIPLANKVDPR